MSDITITAASVSKQGTTAAVETGTAGASITAGQAVYKDATDNKFKLADSNSATAAAREFYGIALHASADGQPLSVMTSGDINIGATVAVGTIYVLSGTAGGIAPAADLASGMYTSVIGVAITTGRIRLGKLVSGVAVP